MRTLESGGISLEYGYSMGWSPDGKMLAVGDHDDFNVWSAETGKLLWHKEQKSVAVVALAWSPDGRRLTTNENNPKGAVRIWESDTGKLLHEVPFQSKELAWSPDGKTLLAGPWVLDTALLIDADSGTVRLKLREDVRGLRCVSWSADGKTIAILSSSGQLRVWDASSGKPLRKMQLTGGDEGIISSAAWSPDGRFLAVVGDSQFNLHDADGKPLGVLLPFDTYGQLAVTADGRYRGNARVERAIRMVVQKADGTTETLMPREFEQKYGWKNEPDKVRLIEK